MVTRPADFDCRSARQVLRLRLRDWMWPSAAAVAIAITFLGRHSGPTYRIGSLTDYANTYGPPLLVVLLAFAGIRWSRIGWPGPRDGQRAWVRLPVTRLLLDVPGLLVAGFAFWIVAMVVLGMFGVIDLD